MKMMPVRCIVCQLCLYGDQDLVFGFPTTGSFNFLFYTTTLSSGAGKLSTTHVFIDVYNGIITAVVDLTLK